MIISCINCNKKFEIKDDLIPKNGRLLQCSGCNHKWFFKKEIVLNTPNDLRPEIIENSNNINIENNKNMPLQETYDYKTNFDNEDNLDKAQNVKKDLTKQNQNTNIFKITLVCIISFISIIILIDTFKKPITKIIPNTEKVLYNLYESIKDILLFFKDLI